ncbi:MAG: CDP-alcohol phosphatidyltransferase family protein [Chloroflexota bacterium]
MSAPDAPKPASLTDWLRATFKWLTDPLGHYLGKYLGIHPNYITVAGFVGTVAGAAALAFGYITIGGIIILLMGPVDALDGAAARAAGSKSTFGAFTDSVTDRYSEAITYLGLMIYYLNQSNQTNTALPMLLIFLAFVGSVMVSYTKARAEALGFECNIGLLTRAERYLILAPLLVFNLPLIALWIIAPLANITALQRIWHVRSQFYSQKKESK